MFLDPRFRRFNQSYWFLGSETLRVLLGTSRFFFQHGAVVTLPLPASQSLMGGYLFSVCSLRVQISLCLQSFTGTMSWCLQDSNRHHVLSWSSLFVVHVSSAHFSSNLFLCLQQQKAHGRVPLRWHPTAWAFCEQQRRWLLSLVEVCVCASLLCKLLTLGLLLVFP